MTKGQRTKNENGYWKDRDNQRKLLDSIGAELGVKQLDDWYNISAKQVKAMKAHFVDHYYNGSLIAALKELYPNHEWNPLRFATSPRNFWKDKDNQRKYLECVGKRLGVKELDDWYNITSKEVKKMKAHFVDHYYNGSLIAALKELYPNHEWNPLRFSVIPRNFWKDKDSQRKHLERIGEELGIKQLDDWYNITAKQVKLKNGTFLQHHNGSLIETLKYLYPDHSWDPLKFYTVPRNFWRVEDNQRKLLEEISEELGVKQMDDWYHVSSKQVMKKAPFIINYYNSSLFDTLKTLYPTHQWDPVKFSMVPRGFWKKESTKQHFFETFKKWIQQHNITKLSDWYNLPPRKVKLFQRVASGIFGGVSLLLSNWFPETNWHSNIHSSTAELELQRMIQLMSKDVKIHHRIEGHSVDVYVPEWRLAIEYQGGQHFQQSWRGDINRQWIRDSDKQRFFKQHNVSLVTVNYLWNGSWSQLKATISQKRPDLLL